MKYLARRAATLIVTMILVSLITFLAFNVIPGDPASIILGTNASPEKVELLRHEMGLDQSLPVRYIGWVVDFIKGDPGKSIRFSEPVGTLILSRLPVTLWLSIMTLLLVFVISIPLGIYTAKKEGTIIDTFIGVVCQVNIAIPSFFLGMLLILVFGIILKMFAPGKYIDYRQDFAGFLGYLIIPALAIALPKIATVVKFLRASVIQQLSSDYVRTAFSKGNKENAVLYGHVLKNALITIITLTGMIVADILAGSIIIEQLFSLPGIGRLLIMSISARDFPLIEVIVVYIAFIVVFMNFIVDVLYQVIDPRIRIN